MGTDRSRCSGVNLMVLVTPVLVFQKEVPEAQSILERGAEAYEQANQTANDVYDKTAQAESEISEQAKSYSSKNPGKTILIALAIGVGLGFLLGAGCCRRVPAGLPNPWSTRSPTLPWSFSIKPFCYRKKQCKILGKVPSLKDKDDRYVRQ